MRPLPLAGMMLFTCLLGLLLSACGSTPDLRLADDLAKTVFKGEPAGRVRCESDRPRSGLWYCLVSRHAASGSVTQVLVEPGRDGCWRASFVSFKRATKSTPPSRAFAGFQSYGRPFGGCTDLDG